MAVSKRLRKFDPHAPTAHLATDQEEPQFAPATAPAFNRWKEARD